MTLKSDSNDVILDELVDDVGTESASLSYEGDEAVRFVNITFTKASKVWKISIRSLGIGYFRKNLHYRFLRYWVESSRSIKLTALLNTPLFKHPWFW